MRQIALISIGSNDLSFWGSSRETVAAAIGRVAALATDTPRVSRAYRTPAFPAGSGPDFVNAAMRFETELAPETLLAELHGIEAAAGRSRSKRWGQRTLDLDLLALGQAVLPDEQTFITWRDLPLAAQTTRAPDQLILPHPRLQDRGFVLVPLSEVAPDWRHPVFGRTAQALCAALPDEDKAGVVPLGDARDA